VTETTAAETPPGTAADAVAESRPGFAATPVWVWVVYGLGILAAVIFAVSFLFVGLAYLTTGDGGFGLHVSTAALVVWLVFLLAAMATYLWRRFGASR